MDRTRRGLPWVPAALVAAWAVAGCGNDSSTTDGGGADDATATDSAADADAEVPAEADAEGGTDGDAETDAPADLLADADAEVEPEADAGPGADADADVEPSTGTTSFFLHPVEAMHGDLSNRRISSDSPLFERSRARSSSPTMPRSIPARRRRRPGAPRSRSGPIPPTTPRRRSMTRATQP